MPRRRSQKDRLIVFGRYPVPGLTKTRLIPYLGSVGAAELQRYLTEKILKEAKSLTGRLGTTLEISFSGGTGDEMRRWLGPSAVYTPQGPGDLGDRMEAAFRRAFLEGCDRVILFGTDVPRLSESALEKAMDLLKGTDLVLGPSTDGGYWLIGLKKNADLFRNLLWGSNDVLSQTLAKADSLGLSAALMHPLTDIDTIEDVQRLLPEWGHLRPYLSVIIPALNEAAHIEKTVCRALCEEAEVIVVDGGSRDGTRKAAVQAGARLLESPKGRAVQQNCGAVAARGRVLLFLHGDTLLPEHYVEHIFRTFLEGNAVLGAFRFKTDLKTHLARILEAMVNFRSRYLRMPYGDQGLFMRKEVFARAGGFPDVPVAEDYFLVRRLRKKGRPVMAKTAVTTSGRRWENVGFFRTTLRNQIILAGIALRISLPVLASIYQHKRRNEQVR
jgi:rSAM/selenodomain-associated transferase 2/rSAM/selenodomain-associated transferase 1